MQTSQANQHAHALTIGGVFACALIVLDYFLSVFLGAFDHFFRQRRRKMALVQLFELRVQRLPPLIQTKRGAKQRKTWTALCKLQQPRALRAINLPIMLIRPLLHGVWRKRTKRNAMTATANSWKQSILARGHQEKIGAKRWFLQGFQQHILRLAFKQLGLVDHKYFGATARWRAMHRGVQHATLAVHAANQRFAQQVNWNVQLLLVAQFAALTYGRQLLANDNTIWMRTGV